MKTLEHRFIENIPDQLEEGVLYISIPFETAIHKCCCGCEKEVVTPLSPSAWSLIFDGETVSLKPSIGNWSFECRSHYWIKRNKVHWSGDFSDEQIARVKLKDQQANVKHYEKEVKPDQPEQSKRWYDWFLGLFR